MRRNARSSTWLPLLLFAALALTPRGASAAWPTNSALNVPICVATGAQAFPRSIPDGAGGAIITWQDLRNTFDTDIYAQRVLASGAVDPAWPVNGRAICTAVGDQSRPRLVTDGAGGAIITWFEGRGFGPQDTHIYAQHLLANGTVDTLWPVNGRAICLAAFSQDSPLLTPDGAGGALIVWQDGRSQFGADVYAARVTATSNTPWTTDGILVSGPTNTGGAPDICGDGAGGAFVVWLDGRNGSTVDVYAHHLLSSGALDPAWLVGGAAVCLAAGNQRNPHIVADGAGGALMTWSDDRGGPMGDIYAHHVVAGGTVDAAWPVNGLAVCTATNVQSNPFLVSDNAGGAIVTWQDMRGPTFSDIYAHHVLAGGTTDPAWPVDGAGLCMAASSQFNPAIAPDGLGGAIVAWVDQRVSPTPDIYAQHVLPGGAMDPAWPADGLGVSTAPGAQQTFTISTDGAGGAIVAWQDRRNPSDDIYAQRVVAYGKVGELVGVEPRGALTFELLPVRPNPSRGSSLIVEFTLDRAGDAKLELFDAAGRRVATRELASLGAGLHRVAFEEGIALRPGVYLVTLRQGARVQSGNVSVLR